MDSATAELLLKTLVDWEGDPTLSQNEIDTLMTLAAIPDENGNAPTNAAGLAGWVSGVVTAGTVIRDSAGRYWRATNSGATGLTQPNWYNQSGLAPGNASVWDGDIKWVDIGEQWDPSFNLDYAAAMGWRIKAAKAANRFAFMTDGQQISRQQVHAQCLTMVREYTRRMSTSVPLQGGW